MAFQAICTVDFLAKVMTKNVRHFKVWLGFLLFIKILLNLLNCSPSIFLLVSLSLSLFVYFIYFFQAWILLEFLSQAFSILYMFFPIFFRYYKYFDKFHLTKNILIKKFFSLKHVFRHSFPSVTHFFEVK